VPRIERVREVLSQPFDAEHFRRKLKEGWRLIVVHWEREVEGEAPARAQWIEEVPYGLRVAATAGISKKIPTNDGLWS
jgi:hypothetical protein